MEEERSYIKGNKFFLPALLVCAVFFCIFWQLGTPGLREPDEARYAEIGREMLVSGDYMIPRMLGFAHLEKPPMTYWLMALSYKIFGINEFAARLIPALSALGTIILLLFIYRRFNKEHSSVTAALILTTIPLFFSMAHASDLNMLLTFWITLAFACIIEWFETGRKYFQIAFYIALAGAFMTKGPPGIAIPILSLMAYRLITRKIEGAPWRRVFSVTGTLIFLSLALPWYLIICFKYPEMWHFWLGQEVAGRIATDIHRRSQPVFYYLMVLPLGILPWIIPFMCSFRTLKEKFKEPSSVYYILAACWLAAPFIMFSLVRSKIATYILPLMPPAAILAALGIERMRSSRIIVKAQLAIIACLGILPLFAIGAAGNQHKLPLYDFMPDGLILVAGCVTAMFLIYNSPRLVLHATVITTSTLMIFFMNYYSKNDAMIGSNPSIRETMSQIKQLYKPGDIIATFGRTSKGMPFYSGIIPTTWYNEHTPQLATEHASTNYTWRDMRDLEKMIDSEQRIFLVLKKTRYKELHELKSKLKVIYEGHSQAILSNK